MFAMYFKKIIFLFLILIPVVSFAEELSISYGVTKQNGNNELTDNWQLGLQQNFSKYFSWSESYINEGHIPDHKRDGLATQIWGQLPLFTSRIKLAVGGGLYAYADTKTNEDNDLNFHDAHGIAPILSAAAAYYFNDAWFAKVMWSHIHPTNNFISNSYVLGIGYNFVNKSKNDSNNLLDLQLPKNAITVYLGQAVANDLQDEKNFAAELEYRRNLLTHFDWTLSGLYENQYSGVGSQLWLVDNFFANKFGIGIGIGPADIKNHLDGLVSFMGVYNFTPNWFGRVLWNRVVSDNNSDRDDFLLGIGYRFGDR